MSLDGDDGPRGLLDHRHAMEPQHHDQGTEPHPYHLHYPPPARHEQYSPDDHHHPPVGSPPDHHPVHGMLQPHPRAMRPENQHAMGPSNHRDYATSPLPLGEGNSPPPSSSRDGAPYPPPYGYGPPAPPPYGYYGGSYYPPGYPPPPHGYPGYPPQPPLPPTHYPYGYPSYPSQQPKERMLPAKLKPPTHVLPQFSAEKHNKSPDFQTDLEIERTRSQSDIKVSPMRTNFHFFVDDVQEAVRTEAQDEYKGDVDFLLYSNMNARFIKKWHELPASAHEAYLGKEEEDRIRFQNDDEIASRHCATLTARALRGDDDDGDGEETVAKKRSSPSNELESPPKKNKPDEGQYSGEPLLLSNDVVKGDDDDDSVRQDEME